jgi:tRNA1Val (adenine37-N6)-methyltransferase
MKSSKSPDIELRPEECLEHFMEARLQLIQSRKGYRFSIDAILLSEFVSVRPDDIVVDLGTGCGIIPLLLLKTRALGHVFGLEIQEELATQAVRNVHLNGCVDKMDIILGDIRRPPLRAAAADLVICNPPYRKINSGRLNPDPRKAVARHEILAALDDVLKTTHHLLRTRGRFALIYPCQRLVDVIQRMRYFALEPKRIRIHYPSAESRAKLALIEATRGGKPGLHIERPLFGQDSDFTSRLA